MFIVYFFYYFNVFLNVKSDKKYTYNISKKSKHTSGFKQLTSNFFRLLFRNRPLFRKYKRLNFTKEDNFFDYRIILVVAIVLGLVSNYEKNEPFEWA